ncbi:Mdm36 [Kluyveromyces lactis]|nr:Mdm36 [Kluyveromyces lactis]
MSYKDPILSQFKNKDTIDAKVITELIEDARVQNTSDSTQIINDELHERTVEKCKESLSIYTDLVKLSFLLAKSWDLKTLEQTVMLRFGLQDIIGSSELASSGNKSQGEDFDRDIALKTISKCDKLSVALEQLSLDSRSVMVFIKQATETNDVTVLLSDAMTLLLEIWFLCGHQLRKLKRKVAAFFMRSKLLLIDYELELINNTNMDSMTQANLESLKETISSYKSFIKVLLQQLRDAETADDQSEFEECLAIFMDVEGMYQAFNFTWLLEENSTLLTNSEHYYAKAQQESDQHDLQELSGINSFVDNSLIDEEEEGETQSESAEGPGDDLDDLVPSSDKLHPSQGRSRRLSNMSGTSDISLMMEKTSLTKELPHLLQAFNNAKKLANDLESVRELGSTTPPTFSPFSSPNCSSSMSLDNSTTMNSSILSNHIGIKPPTASGSSKVLESLAHRQQEFPYASSSPLNPSPLSKLEMSQQLIRQDMLKLMSQTPNNANTATITAKVPGFGSNILNNLYGIGSKN